MKTPIIGTATSDRSAPHVRFRAFARRCQRQVLGLLSPYRPERYYMRGPGPKCRSKEGILANGLP